jgi:hypothetical protein
LWTCLAHLLEGSQDLVVGRLGLVVGVEQEGVALGPPRVLVADTPNGDTDAVLLVDASLDNVGPVGGRSVLDVDLSHGTLRSGTAKSSHGGDGVGTLAGCQVGLRTNTVNGDTSSDPLLDVADHGGRLCVGSRVEVVVVDVTLRVGVSRLGGLESDAHKVLPEDVVEDTGT